MHCVIADGALCRPSASEVLTTTRRRSPDTEVTGSARSELCGAGAVFCKDSVITAGAAAEEDGEVLEIVFGPSSLPPLSACAAASAATGSVFQACHSQRIGRQEGAECVCLCVSADTLPGGRFIGRLVSPRSASK